MGSEGTGRTVRVLVVEDDEETAALFQDLLHEFGYEPLLARSAEAARMTFETERPDVILLDVKLPMMSGLDFLQLDPVRRSGVPILATSGAATEDEARECLRRGALDFLPKPIDADLLRQLLVYAEVIRAGPDEPRPPTERRRSTRPRAAIRVRVIEYDGAEWGGTCVDLGTFGMKVQGHRGLTPGTAARVLFALPDGGPRLDLLSILIRRVDPESYAFRFVNLTKTDFQRLRDFVEGMR